MTDQSSPIRPPCELVQQWITRWVDTCQRDCDFRTYLATQSAQWGWDQRGTINAAQLQERADQELEACIQWLVTTGYLGENGKAIPDLRAARRPKPPSLKEQAMRVLVENGTNLDGRMELDSTDIETIRRALEALPND